MQQKIQKLNTITQNLLLGSVTGVVMGNVLRIVFTRAGVVDLAWIAFIAIGPTVGYLSGKEREKYERLQNEKKKMEENMETIQSALDQSKKKYQLLVERANDAIFLTTIDGRFLLFNEATCLFSGYSRKELKNIKLSQLKLHETNHKHAETYLDNGIYRYEEIWQSRNGNEVLLEINARWIHFGGHRVILHVGRNVDRKKAVSADNRCADIQKAQEKRFTQMAKNYENIYKQIMAPAFNTVKQLNHIKNQYPENADKMNELLSEWDKAHKVMAELSAKNNRDLINTPQKWNLNDILHQELVYLDTILDSSHFIVKTNFSDDIPEIFGSGLNYSLAFGTVFNALIESMSGLKQKGMYISTKLLDETILVEILAPGSDTFNTHLTVCLDPFYNPETSLKESDEIGLAATEMFFKRINAGFDHMYEKGKGTIIRIRIPVCEKESSSVKNMKIIGSKNGSLVI